MSASPVESSLGGLAKGVDFWLAIAGAGMILFWALYFVRNMD